MDNLLLVVALSLSVVSGLFSIIGLTTIFPASYWPVVIMGTLLETAKVVAVSWLNRRWPVLRWHLKMPIVAMVIFLMGITSLGVFGYLSKAHIDQQVKIGSEGTETVELLKAKINPKKEELIRINNQLDEKSSVVTGLLKKGREKEALSVTKSDRKDLESRKRTLEKELEPLQESLIRAKTMQRKLEAEVGPLKYITQLFQDNPSEDTLEKSVRILIVVLVLVFDPFAVLMLIAYNNVISRSGAIVPNNKEPEKVSVVNPPVETTPIPPIPLSDMPQKMAKRGVGRPLGSRDKFPPRKQKTVYPVKSGNSVRISKKDLLDLRKIKAAKRAGGQVFTMIPPATKKKRRKKK